MNILYLKFILLLRKEEETKQPSADPSFYECPICLSEDKFKENLICRKCSVAVCKTCWEGILEEDKKCPHCRKEIENEDLIKNLFFTKHIEEIEKLKITCKKHKEKTEMYCYTCNTEVCSKCIIQGKQHRDHRIMAYEEEAINTLKLVFNTNDNLNDLNEALRKYIEVIKMQDDFDFDALRKLQNGYKKRFRSKLDNIVGKMERKYQRVCKGYFKINESRGVISEFLREINTLLNPCGKLVQAFKNILLENKDISEPKKFIEQFQNVLENTKNVRNSQKS